MASSQSNPPGTLLGCSIIGNERLGILQVLDIMLSSLSGDDDYKDTSANSLVPSQHLGFAQEDTIRMRYVHSATHATALLQFFSHPLYLFLTAQAVC